MKLAQGFCDLNISATDTDLRQTVLKALSLGYQTIAINREVTDKASAGGGGGKKKKKDTDSSPVVPPPPKLTFSPDDLRRHGITRQPVILTRLTIVYSTPDSPFLSKHREVLKAYDLLAVCPSNEKTLKQILSQGGVEFDIITLNPAHIPTIQRQIRKLLGMAIKKDMYLEVTYSPCLTEGTGRQQTITYAHSLHRSVRSANVFITSGAHHPGQLRRPYDIINLARFLGLTEAGAKAAVARTAHNLVYCAAMRRHGAGRCSARVTVLKKGGIKEEEEEVSAVAGKTLVVEGKAMMREKKGATVQRENGREESKDEEEEEEEGCGKVSQGKRRKRKKKEKGGKKRKWEECKFDGLEDARKYLRMGVA